MPADKASEEARALISSERDGMLCTLSSKLEGWPFGSIAPYALGESGEPLLLISEIAEHTRNLRADARVSLLVRDSRALADPQAGARATLIGYAMPVPAPYLEHEQARYLELFPNASSFFQAHDFSLFQIKVSQVRFIGGFGEIYWLPAEQALDRPGTAAADPLASQAAGICEHMNQDHADALVLFSRQAALQANAARMIHVDAFGFDVVAITGGAHKHLRVDFPSPVATSEETRAAMIELVRRARRQSQEASMGNG
jgi:putative heme iron utilization protein